MVSSCNILAIAALQFLGFRGTEAWNYNASTSSASPSSTSTPPPPHPPPCSNNFTITSSGGVSGVAGQLPDGQIRVNGSYPTSYFSLDGDQITDAAGRGCIVTPDPTTQFQCDYLTSPTDGFSVDSSGALLYQGSSVFYACPATDTEYNLYTNPNFGQSKCVKVHLQTSTNSNCCPAAPAASTVTVYATYVSTVTETVSTCLTSSKYSFSNTTTCSSKLSSSSAFIASISG